MKFAPIVGGPHDGQALPVDHVLRFCECCEGPLDIGLAWEDGVVHVYRPVIAGNGGVRFLYRGEEQPT